MTPLDTFSARLARGGPIVADGAWGTMLLDRGLPASAAPEAWTVERPDVIAAIAAEYLDAGAEVITTNTFGGSRFRLAQNRIGHTVETVNRRGVEIAKRAAGERAYVSASIGPSGLLLRPHGEADPEMVRDGFVEQAAALASAGAELFCVETMTDLHEAALAIAAVRQVAPAATVMATMTFDMTPRGPFTVMGISVANAARGLSDAGAAIVGANCGTGVEAMTEVARAFLAETKLPVAVRANAGLPQRRAGRLVYIDSPARFAAAAARMLRDGVTLVGGCCGTTPAHIQAVVGAVRSAP